MQAEHFLFFTRSIQGKTAILESDDAHHAHSVLRLGPGDTLQFTDGKGTVYAGVVESTAQSRVIVSITQAHTIKNALPPIELFVGIPEKNAFERLLDMVVPLGVSGITPVICQFCQKPWWKTRWDKIHDRLEKKMIVGIKQSKSAFLPHLHLPQPFAQALKAAPSDHIHLVASYSGSTVFSVHNQVRKASGITCWVGPPGGFSEKETITLSGDSFHEIRLAPNRLRTELAAAVIVSNMVQCGFPLDI